MKIQGYKAVDIRFRPVMLSLDTIIGYQERIQLTFDSYRYLLTSFWTMGCAKFLCLEFALASDGMELLSTMPFQRPKLAVG